MNLSNQRRTAAVAVCIALSGCAAWVHRDIEDAAGYLDFVEKDVEEWGSLSASGLVLLDAKKQFAISFDQKAEDYVKRARDGVQASAASFTETVLRAQLAAEARIEQIPDPAEVPLPIPDPPPAPTHLRERRRLQSGAPEPPVDGRAPGDLLAQIATGEAQGEPPVDAQEPTDLSTQDPAPSAGNATEDASGDDATASDEGDGGESSGGALIAGRPAVLETLNTDRFADPFSLSSDPTAISEGDAVKLGLSQKLGETLFKFLADPEGIPENKRAFFGVITLNCNPGWRTRQEFTGEVSVRFEFAIDRQGWERLGIRERLQKVGDLLRKKGVDGKPRETVSPMMEWLDRADADLARLVTEQEGPSRLSQVQEDLATLEKLVKPQKTPLEETCEKAQAALEKHRANRRLVVTSQRDLDPDATEVELAQKAKEACEAAAEEKKARERQVTERKVAEIRWRYARVFAFLQEVEWHFDDEPYLTSNSELGKRMHDGAQRPEVVSVLPFVESQNMDLRAGRRWQTELGLQLGLALAAAGREVEAEQISEFVRRQQFDVESRTTVPVLTSFVDGNVFGMRFRPAFTAMEDPTKAGSDAAFVLQPTTLPCVVLLVADKSAAAVWKYAAWEVNERWLPLETHGWARRAFVDWWLDGHVFESFTNDERIARAAAIDAAQESVLKAKQEDGGRNMTRQLEEVERRLAHVTSYGAGRTDYTILPGWPPKAGAKPKAPVVSAVVPDRLWINVPTLIHVTGENFTHDGKSIVKSVTVAGQTCAFTVTSKESLYALVPKWSDDHPVSAVNTGLVSVVSVAGVNAPHPLSQVTIDRWRNTAADQVTPLHPSVQVELGGKVYTVRLPAGVPVNVDRVLRAIERAVDAERRCCPKTAACGMIPCVCVPCACSPGAHGPPPATPPGANGS